MTALVLLSLLPVCACLQGYSIYLFLWALKAHINVLNTHACTYVGIRSKQKQGGGPPLSREKSRDVLEQPPEYLLKQEDSS